MFPHVDVISFLLCLCISSTFGFVPNQVISYGHHYGYGLFLVGPNNRLNPLSSSTTVTGSIHSFETNTIETPTSPQEVYDAQEWDKIFDCDDSVRDWYRMKQYPVDNDGKDLQLQRAQEIISSYLDISPLSMFSSNRDDCVQAQFAYWVSHVIRSGYFITNAALGTAASEILQRFMDTGSDKEEVKVPSFSSRLTKPGVVSRIILETILTYEQDWKLIQDGILKFPWDATIRPTMTPNTDLELQWRHRQLNPLFVLRETSKFVQESVRVLSRRSKFQGQPSNLLWFQNQQQQQLFNDERLSTITQYPDYFLNDFHYQTDGWMSSQSAQVYEMSTECLFAGRQDAMQRITTLTPLVEHFNTNEEKVKPTSILEIACGTGRFSTFVRDHFPTAQMTLTDLSPYYLEKARENDIYWEDFRGEAAWREEYSDIDSAAPNLQKTNFVQANAERLPFDDDTFDAVTCVYLFHELPPEARANAAKEMARVVKPGGIVVLTDSLQLGDRPALDSSIGNFSYLNEPYYESYIHTNLGALFESQGLVPWKKFFVSNTKSLSFV